uniref:Uncharacterized protein n=1 Tax=Timema monikensis TaxID=170555 RepID=A0A7R9EC44_9NEOP|nr:unnamed protein product [Timema monikensis]
MCIVQQSTVRELDFLASTLGSFAFPTDSPIGSMGQVQNSHLHMPQEYIDQMGRRFMIQEPRDLGKDFLGTPDRGSSSVFSITKNSENMSVALKYVSLQLQIFRESGKPFRKSHPQCTRPGLNPDLPVNGSLLQHEISALDHTTNEVGFISGDMTSTCLYPLQVLDFLHDWSDPNLLEASWPCETRAYWSKQLLPLVSLVRFLFTYVAPLMVVLGVDQVTLVSTATNRDNFNLIVMWQGGFSFPRPPPPIPPYTCLASVDISSSICCTYYSQKFLNICHEQSPDFDDISSQGYGLMVARKLSMQLHRNRSQKLANEIYNQTVEQLLLYSAISTALYRRAHNND